MSDPDNDAQKNEQASVFVLNKKFVSLGSKTSKTKRPFPFDKLAILFQPNI